MRIYCKAAGNYNWNRKLFMGTIRKYSVRMLRLCFGVLLVYFIYTAFIMGDQVPLFDVVMVDRELYFVLENRKGIGYVDIGSEKEAMWQTETHAYPKARHFKYGQKLEVHSYATEPKKLQKNMEYTVALRVAHYRSTSRTFIITDDNKVIMLRYFDPKRPKNRTVVIERNGKRITVPYSISIDKDGNKVSTSSPIPAN